MVPFVHKDRCCNPFKEKRHKIGKSLRHPSEACIIKMPSLIKEQLICSSCRHRIRKMLPKQITPELDKFSSTLSKPLSQDSSLLREISDVSINTRLEIVNDAIALINQSPIPRRKLKYSSHQWALRKVNRIANNLRGDLGVPTTSRTQSNVADYSEMFLQVKERFDEPNTDYYTKLQLLTLLPKSWSVAKIMGEMGVTRHMAKSAKKLFENHGILSTPAKKRGKPLSPDLIAEVIKFYQDDEVSAVMPGKKDFVSVKDHASGRRIHRQKRLILSNLKELYEAFKQQYPGQYIGFSKFASLRPKHCVLAGASGTHTVCVCSLHENMKLLIEASNLRSLTKDHEHRIQNYEDVLMLLTCDDERADCYLNNCNECPGTQKLQEMLSCVFNDANMMEINYKQWVSKPRTSLESMTSSVPEFIEEICKQAKILLPHSYIAKQQSRFLKSAKTNLQAGEGLVICDFAENYAFVIQNAAPGFHWNNSQATIYPVVIYYKDGDILKHKSLVIVSDHLKHDAIAVYTFSKIINKFVRTFIQTPRKIVYFSDGAPQQFKNYKNFANVYYHEADFKVPAEWHFFATAHGKGPCDGIGGTIKRLAARASLQLPSQQQITTPRSLYEWAKQNIPGITVEFSDSEAYEQAQNELDGTRFATAKATPQTQKNHCLVPLGNGNVALKRYSSATT